MDLDELSPEIRERARACKSAEELVALAKKEGVMLTDEQIDAISGGSWTHSCSDFEDNEWW